MKAFTLTFLGFAIGLMAHFGFIAWRFHSVRAAWADAPMLSLNELSAKYYADAEYIIGLAVACSFAFAAFILQRTLLQTRMKLTTLAGAGGFSTVVAVFGCFLAGCCGSPMLVVYAGIFGVAFAPLAKWLTLMMTLAFIGFGYWSIRRNEKKCLSDCACAPDWSSPQSDQ